MSAEDLARENAGNFSKAISRPGYSAAAAPQSPLHVMTGGLRLAASNIRFLPKADI